MMNESVDRRVLGAFRFVDAITGNIVTDPMAITVAAWQVKPNHSGTYVIFNGPGFEDLTTQFTPSSWPPPPTPPTFEVTVPNAGLRYQSRRVNIKAPQALTPATDPNSIFNPQKVSLYPNAAAPVAPGWSVIYVSVVASGSNPPQGLPWPVLQLTRNSDGKVIATGAGDFHGEALLAVTGLKMQPATGASSPLAATLKAWVDPTLRQNKSDWIPNPDDLLGNTSNPILKSGSAALQITAGQIQSTSIPISV